MRTEIKSIFARTAMTLVLALLTTATAWANDVPYYTVTLQPGEGTGATIVLNTKNDYYGESTNGGDVPGGKFFTMTSDGNSLYFKAPGCPDSFTAPDGKVLNNWDGVYSSGAPIKVSSNLTLTAQWKINGACSIALTDALSFNVEDFDQDGFAPVTFSISQLDFGPYANEYSYIELSFGEGEISKDGGATRISFEVFSADHNNGGRNFKYHDIYSTGTYEIAIRIDPNALAAAAPGTYTGKLDYDIGWYECGDYDWDNTPVYGNFALTLVVPEREVTLADDTDNDATLSSNSGKQCTVTLSGRTLYTDGDWNTLCLPFSVASLSGTPLDGFTVMELDGQTSYLADGTLYLNFTAATSIEAGKPYIVKKLQTEERVITPTITATSGTAGSADGQGYDKLVDGSTDGYRWRTDMPSGTMSFCEFHADQLINVGGYTLTTGNQATTGDPTVWTLYGKQTESDAWTTIDSRDATQDSGDALPGGRTEGKNYTAQNPGTYRYFRFEVEQTGSNFLCLTELTLQCTTTAPVNVENPTFTHVTIDASAPQPVTSQDGKVSFVGSYDPLTISGEDRSILFLGAENTLYYPNAAMTLGSCRAHFQLSGITAGDPAAGVRAFVLSFDDMDGATGIISVNGLGSTVHGSDAWYTLSGVRLSGKPTAKGIYINNGRKFVIK